MISVKKKYQLFKKQLKNSTDHNIKNFRIFKNKLTTMIRLSKQLYYKKSLEEAQNSPCKTWSLINYFIKKESKSNFPEVFSLEDGSTTNNSEKVADILNPYFAKIGEKIESSVMKKFDSRSNKHFSSYLPSPQSNSIFLGPISHSEITKIVCDLNPG